MNRAIGKEVATTPAVTTAVSTQPPILSPADVGLKQGGRGKKSKSKNKSRSASQSTVAQTMTSYPTTGKASCPLSWTTSKRSTTPSPTMSSSSQRSQSPPSRSSSTINLPPPPTSSLPVPAIKVVTTKEETRLFKLKPTHNNSNNAKKVKAKPATTTTNSNDHELKLTASAAPKSPSVAIVSAVAVSPVTHPVDNQLGTVVQQVIAESTDKRGRSSSVPSNSRNNDVVAPVNTPKAPPVVVSPPTATPPAPKAPLPATAVTVTATKKPSQVSPPIVTVAAVNATATGPTSSTVWQPRTHTKPLIKNPTIPLLQPTTNRPQPPVGKILPEVRRVQPEVVDHPVLPKPIGYRSLEKSSPLLTSMAQSLTSHLSSWSATDPSSPPWYNPAACPVNPPAPSAPSGAWWPDGGSPLTNRNVHPLDLTSSPQRDWMGLSESSSTLMSDSSPMWPVHTFPSAGSSAATDTWSDRHQPETQVGTFNNPVSRVFSPWSVPHWLDVTQSRQQRNQDPIAPLQHQNLTSVSGHPYQSVAESGILPTATNNNNNTNGSLWEPDGSDGGKDSWSSYSQF